ncbi:MAG: enoyl-CoA hydratase-related protein, partial [Nocardioides sp.]|uniref:enoyl-CoA hydratase-related protein n=1 Tax=Nocardioides sp. TaxID=35761 RepID=UPI0039E48B61
MTDARTPEALAKALYDALAAGDRPGVLELLTPDFVGRTTAGLPLGLGGRYEGAEEMIDGFWWRLGRSFAARAEAEAFAELADGRLQVTGTYRGTARATGRAVEAAFIHLVTVSEGRIAALEQLTDTAAWADAVSGGAVAFPAYAGPGVGDLETFGYEVRDGVARVTLRRPEQRNAIDLRVAEETLTIARALQHDPSVRAVLITGEGEWLTAGGDIDYFRQWPEESYGAVFARMTTPFHEAMRIFSEIEAPIVTAVNGLAVGGGLLYVYVADIVIAADDATFSTVFTGIGLPGDGGGTWYLPRLIGAARAKRMYLENLRIDAATALDWGLVAEVVPAAELAERAEARVARLAAGP